jgi:hypothetical protein
MSEWELPSTVEVVSTERVGGGSYLWESGVYKATVKMVYLDQAKSGAVSFNVILTNQEGKELREAMYIKSGNAKGNKTYYEKDGKQYPLPGYATANSLCVAATGQALPQCMESIEKKMVNIYNVEAQKEVPTERPVVMTLLNKVVTVAVHEVVEDKNIKNAAGEYVPSGETRSRNECKFFGNADGLTAEEIEKGLEASKFKQWADKNAGKKIDRSKGASGNSAAPAAAAPAPTASSMFS